MDMESWETYGNCYRQSNIFKANSMNITMINEIEHALSVSDLFGKPL